MGHILLALLFVIFWGLLTLFFVYTIIAIFKGASYVPTTHARVARLLDIAEIKAGDRVLDLGSGDGRILFAAAKRGATCVGVEINPLLVLYSAWMAKLKGLAGVSIMRRDFWRVDLADIDVLTVYLVPIRLDQLKAKVHSEMKSGSRVVTAVHHFPDWVPERSEGDICLYRIP
jgi:SAM-dependent methyltransferase